ncbi:AraC family transcriptional regulator [Phaeobacter sp. HF9A]|uniref:AraC-like ligand-binding domain-containing protein n=1 Tax=Phaeobacter sp. HF9A TaxID=2721561 RepID=UPI001430C4ED|nr:AraC family transcriptional regulator [Phaeobacter sp. HF9A]
MLDSPGLLGHFPPVCVEDLSAAHRHVTQHFGAHLISKSRHDADLRFVHRHAQLGSLSFNTLSYGADVDVHVGWVDRPLFLMMVPLEGRAQIVQGGQRSEAGRGHLVILDPREPFDLHLSAGQRNLTIGIPAETLKQALAARRQDHARLSFSHQAQVVDGAVSMLMRFTDFLCGELDLAQAGGMVPNVSQALEASFLHLFLQGALEPDKDMRRVVPRSVRVAQRYMMAHLKDPLSTEAVAQAAGISQRTLRAHFAEACGVSPGRWLLQQRLTAARRDLTEGATSVTEVALQYAFGNVGRFSRAYRDAYGEYPSQTLTNRH